MQAFVKFSIGLVSHVVGLVAEHFAHWLFQQVSSGDDGWNLLDNLRQFGQAFLQMVAGQLSGHSTRGRYDHQEQDWEPGQYRS